MIYTGSELTQSPVVKLNGTALTEGTDYKLSYADNIAVGTAILTVTGKHTYSGTATATFKINPKATSIVKIKSKKKKLVVKWNVQSAKMPTAQITGYKIQIAKNKTFTKGVKNYTVNGYSKTSKTIKKLKAKKKYYVRVKTYMKTNTGTYESAWSPVKAKKTK